MRLPPTTTAPIYGFNKHYINSLFANAELGWKSMLFLTLTGRNDWDSALAGTKHESFFYPSVGMSASSPRWCSCRSSSAT